MVARRPTKREGCAFAAGHKALRRQRNIRRGACGGPCAAGHGCATVRRKESELGLHRLRHKIVTHAAGRPGRWNCILRSTVFGPIAPRPFQEVKVLSRVHAQQRFKSETFCFKHRTQSDLLDLLKYNLSALRQLEACRQNPFAELSTGTMALVFFAIDCKHEFVNLGAFLAVEAKAASTEIHCIGIRSRRRFKRGRKGISMANTFALNAPDRADAATRIGAAFMGQSRANGFFFRCDDGVHRSSTAEAGKGCDPVLFAPPLTGVELAHRTADWRVDSLPA